MSKLRVIDFFCGAGGFSEGFRQMGYEIVYGFDHWRPAVDTYNHNFSLNCEVKNILDFKHSIDEIEKLPNTEIIIGSPPCVSFSSSNKSGNADKSLGVELTETFLRIVAVKKHQPNSILKAWFMENVVNSKRYLQTSYTFKDLDLTEWANKYRINPFNTAIDLYDNTAVINSADYGSFQARKRLIAGEIISKRKLIMPPATHDEDAKNGKAPYMTIGMMKKQFPNPYSDKSDKIIKCIKKEIEEVKDKTLIPYVFAEKIIPLIYPYHTPTIPLTRGIIEEKIENYTPTVKEKKKENNIKKEKEKIKKEFEEEFEELWKEYPKKEGKGEALKSYIKFRGEYSKEDCLKAIKNYVKQKIDIDKTEYKFLKMGSTFFNCFPEYINIVPGNGKKEIKEVEPDDDIDNWGYRTEFKKETAV